MFSFFDHEITLSCFDGFWTSFWNLDNNWCNSFFQSKYNIHLENRDKLNIMIEKSVDYLDEIESEASKSELGIFDDDNSSTENQHKENNRRHHRTRT